MDVNMHLDKMGSPVMYALVLRQPDKYVAFLLDQGANPDEYDVLDWTSMERAVQSNPGLVAKFLAHGAQARGTRALGIAANRGEIDAVRILIPYFDADINELLEDWTYLGKDDEVAFGTALHNAALNGHLETTQALLDVGADASLRDSLGNTASYIAKEKGFEELVKLLKAYWNSDDVAEEMGIT